MAVASHGDPHGASDFVKSKLEEFFWEWMALPESQKIVRQQLQIANGEAVLAGRDASTDNFPSPSFSPLRSPSSHGRPSPPGSPLSSRSVSSGASTGAEGTVIEFPSSTPSIASSSRPTTADSDLRATCGEAAELAAAGEAMHPVATSMLGSGSKTVPQFYFPKRTVPQEALDSSQLKQIHDCFIKQGIKEITEYSQLETVVTEVFGLSKYFVVPVFHKIKVHYGIVADEALKSKTSLVAASAKPITEQMVVAWCNGRIQPDDPVLTFFYVVKKDSHNWIEREDFSIFLTAILLTHPGLDFLRETQEFQDRYADTVISRIFFVYDRKDVGRIYLKNLRRYKPSVIETWKQLSENDDIKMVRDYFSYEQFYVIYCTFWELDADHDFLLDKDDLLKYDGHALSRRALDRIFSEIPTKFTSAVPGKMGYEDFIRFLLCDQDRQSDRSMEYWFQLFDLDSDCCIRDHELKYFYEEQVQRMECLNYETISFVDVMCQMNDMVFPRLEGQFRLSDFKRKRKFAGTFFSIFSSLNKFLAFEHRDPFQSKQDQLDNPNQTDWDRWCADEYLRLAMDDGEDPEDDSRGGAE